MKNLDVLPLVLVLSVVFLIGCGPSSPFDYVPVKGKVCYEDGTPIPAKGSIQLVFDSQAPPVGDAHPRPGNVFADADGNFDKVTSYKYGDGLTPGKHKVSIYYATDAKGNLLVPAECTRGSTTPLLIDTADTPLEIKVPRP